ncbi:hypothetical protein GCM10027610_133370 [Dactylosporangium cerinum]
MVADGLGADHQVTGDAVIGAAGRDEVEDLAFAAGQLRETALLPALPMSTRKNVMMRRATVGPKIAWLSLTLGGGGVFGPRFAGARLVRTWPGRCPAGPPAVTAPGPWCRAGSRGCSA